MGELTITQAPGSELSAHTLEQLVLKGDIKELTPQAKVDYYIQLCRSLDLNPASQPFQVIAFQGREQLYAKKDATDQLRARRGISITKLERCTTQDVFEVTAYGVDKEGRTDAATGAVTVKGLTGDALANAHMKAETKAKRRLTLSLAGLGMLDETEIETIPGAKELKVIDVTPPAGPTPEAPVQKVDPFVDARLQTQFAFRACRDSGLFTPEEIEAMKGEGAKHKDNLPSLIELTRKWKLQLEDRNDPKWRHPIQAVGVNNEEVPF